MTRSTSRVLALLELLQQGGTRTVAECAERLGVDERTVRRYVTHLHDLDIPVDSVRGRYGGYRLSPGYRMPPLMLTEEEALAVQLGLLTGRRSGRVPGSVAATESAAAKVRRVLPEAVRRRLDAVLATTESTTTPTADRSTVPDARVLLVFAEAALGRRPVALTYTSREGRSSERVLHPYGIVAHAGHWYVTGDDSRSGEVRTFRLDRVRHTAVQPGSFDVPAGFDPSARVVAGVREPAYAHHVSVRVRGSASRLRARLPAIVTVHGPEDDAVGDGPGWVRVTLRAERLDWVPALLAGMDAPFVIEGPEDLRPLMRSWAARLSSYADAR